MNMSSLIFSWLISVDFYCLYENNEDFVQWLLNEVLRIAKIQYLVEFFEKPDLLAVL